MTNLRIFLLFVVCASAVSNAVAQNCYGYRDTGFYQNGAWTFDSASATSVSVRHRIKLIGEEIFIWYRGHNMPNSAFCVKKHALIDTTYNSSQTIHFFADSSLWMPNISSHRY